MNKKELVEMVAEDVGESQVKVGRILEAILSAIRDEVAVGGKVVLSDFGTFRVSERKPFRGRNPRTGQTVDVPGIRLPIFHAGKGFKDLTRW